MFYILFSVRRIAFGTIVDRLLDAKVQYLEIHEVDFFFVVVSFFTF